MANPLLAGKQPQKSDNPLLGGAMPAPEPPKKLFAVTPAAAAAQEKANTPETPGFLSTVGQSLMDNPLLQQVENFYGFKPEDSKLKDVGKVGAHLALAIPSMGFQAVDIATNQIADNQPVEGDSVITRVGKAIASSPPAVIGGVVKKLLFDPQANLISEGVKQYGEGIKQAIDAHNKGAGIIDSLKVGETSGNAGVTNIGLGTFPVGGPLIANTAEQIGTTGKVLGPALELAGNAALLGAGIQEGRAAKARTAATKEFVDATLSNATQSGMPFDKNATLAAAKNLSTQDLIDTAKSARENAAKNASISAAKQRMAQPAPEVAPTDVVPETIQPEIKAKVPESNPAIPAKDLAAIDKNLAKRDVPVDVNPQTGPQEGSPAPALISDEEHTALEKAGFTVDSKGRLARLVNQSRPSNPEAGQAALEPSVNPTPVFTPEAPAQPKGLLPERTAGIATGAAPVNSKVAPLSRASIEESANAGKSIEESHPINLADGSAGKLQQKFFRYGDGNWAVDISLYSDSGKPLARLNLNKTEVNPGSNAPKSLGIGMTSLDGSQHGKGIGRQLYLEAISAAKRTGAEYLYSDTQVSPDAQRVWKSIQKQYPDAIESVAGNRFRANLKKIPNGATPETATPTFTNGDQPGANYTSEQLKAFKEKNGIKTEPVQMVGEKPSGGTSVAAKIAAKVADFNKQFSLPAVADGMVRLFRGEESGATRRGRYFTDDPAIANRYSDPNGGNGSLHYVDVPAEKVAELQGKTGKTYGAPYGGDGGFEYRVEDPNHFGETKVVREPQGLKTNLLKGRRTGETGAVRPDLLFGAPAEAVAKGAKAVGESVSEGKGIAAAVANEQQNKPLPKFAGGVNLEKAGTIEDVKRQILDVYESDPKKLDSKRGGVQSHEETVKRAQKLVEDGHITTETLKKVKAGKAGNATELNAAGSILQDLAAKAKSTRDAYAKESSQENSLKMMDAIHEQIAVQATYSGQATEAGRALNSLKITREAMRSKSMSNFDKALEALGNGKVEVGKEILETLAKIPENDVAGFNRMIRDHTKFTTPQKVRSYWIADILSGVGTQVQNFFGNLSNTAAETAARGVAGTIDAAKSAVTGSPREVYAKEALVSTRARIAAINDALSSARTVFKQGTESAKATAVAPARYYELPGGIKNPLNIPLRILSAADVFNETMGVSGEMHALAYRAAAKEGLKGKALIARMQELITQKPEWLTDGAIAQARRETYKQPLGDVAKNAIKARDADKTGTLGFLFPFAEIPINFTKANFDYSPLGPAKLFFKDVSPVEKRTIAARAAVGTAVAAWAAYKATQGELTGATPKDPGQRDAFFRQGKKPFSVFITPPGAKDGMWVRAAYFGPFALTMGAVASAHDAYQVNHRLDMAEIAKQAGTGAASAMTNQSFFQGLLNVSNILNGDTGKLEQQGSSIAQGFVPLSGFLRSVAQTMDTVDRQPRDDNAMQKQWEMLKTNLPVLSETVPSRLNALGEESKNSRLRLFGLNDRTVNNPDIEKELARLEVTPKAPDKSLNISSSQFELTRDQQRELTDLTGQARKQSLRSLFADQQDVTLGKGSDRETLVYSKMDDEQKRKAIEHVLHDAQDAARDEFVNRVNSRNEAVKEKPKKAKLLFVGAQ